jgi:glycosyltransferase involved in cell wall biosynthesis
LAPSGDSAALADCILRLCNDSELRQKLAENFYSKAKADFSVERMALTHKEIYTKIIKEK